MRLSGVFSPNGEGTLCSRAGTGTSSRGASATIIEKTFSKPSNFSKVKSLIYREHSRKRTGCADLGEKCNTHRIRFRNQVAGMTPPEPLEAAVRVVLRHQTARCAPRISVPRATRAIHFPVVRGPLTATKHKTFSESLGASPGACAPREIQRSESAS